MSDFLTSIPPDGHLPRVLVVLEDGSNDARSHGMMGYSPPWMRPESGQEVFAHWKHLKSEVTLSSASGGGGG